MSPSPNQVTACVLVIGNEILSGRTADVNAAYLAGALGEAGVALCEVRFLRDDEPAIVDAVNECRARYDWVLTTGGIGPTHDDITAPSIAKAFAVELPIDERARARLAAHYKGGELEMNEARLRMARIPKGAVLVDNPVSGAPGFRIENVIVMAGVPSIMRAMFEGVRDLFAGGAVVRAHTVTARIGEGDLAGPLAAVQERFADVEIGSYPFFHEGRPGCSVVARSADSARLEAVGEALAAMLRKLGADLMPEPPP